MKISFESKFANDLRNIKDGMLLVKVKELIIECKEAKSLIEIKNVKKLHGYDTFYPHRETLKNRLHSWFDRLITNVTY